MVPVYLESPYAYGGTADDPTIERNIRYLRACMRHCLLQGEAPFASHALYTQPGVLRDELPLERRFGIDAGEPFRKMCAYTVWYADLLPGVGVEEGKQRSEKLGQEVAVRRIGEGWEGQYRLSLEGTRSPSIWSRA